MARDVPRQVGVTNGPSRVIHDLWHHLSRRNGRQNSTGCDDDVGANEKSVGRVSRIESRARGRVCARGFGRRRHWTVCSARMGETCGGCRVYCDWRSYVVRQVLTTDKHGCPRLPTSNVTSLRVRSCATSLSAWPMV